MAIAGVVGDDGQLPGALFVKGIEQIVGDTNSAKSATNTVDPSRTPATASAVVFARLSITSKNPFERHCCLTSVAYATTDLGWNRPSTPVRRKAQIPGVIPDLRRLPAESSRRTATARDGRRHHNGFGDEIASCKVPPPCF
jgi:hypothetical protein